MRKACATPQIEDVTYENCPDDTLSLLLDIFEHAMKSTAISGARSATYDLGDFAMGPRAEWEGGTLKLERTVVLGQEQWFGRIDHREVRVEVLGTLEED